MRSLPRISCVLVVMFAAAICAPNPVPAQQAVPGGTPANAPAQLPQLADGVVYSISPSDADPRVQRFTASNLALFRHDVPRNAPLLVYFSGTGGTPMTGWLFLEAGAKAGYRVIGLEYDNASSVPGICEKKPDETCSDRFRQKRVFGDDVTKDIDDLPAESIVNRLTKLLQYLDEHHRADGWGRYLRKGQPDWSRIAFAGHSQGGGMAAFIAKKKRVARVIVISGAADRVETTKGFAPWVASKSATPMNRWYAAYHAKESRAAALKSAASILRIPAEHVRVLSLEPNPQIARPPNVDVYHGSMVSAQSTPRDSAGNPAYAGDWAFMLGQAGSR